MKVNDARLKTIEMISMNICKMELVEIFDLRLVRPMFPVLGSFLQVCLLKQPISADFGGLEMMILRLIMIPSHFPGIRLSVMCYLIEFQDAKSMQNLCKTTFCENRY